MSTDSDFGPEFFNTLMSYLLRSRTASPAEADLVTYLLNMKHEELYTKMEGLSGTKYQWLLCFKNMYTLRITYERITYESSAATDSLLTSLFSVMSGGGYFREIPFKVEIFASTTEEDNDFFEEDLPLHQHPSHNSNNAVVEKYCSVSRVRYYIMKAAYIGKPLKFMNEVMFRDFI